MAQIIYSDHEGKGALVDPNDIEESEATEYYHKPTGQRCGEGCPHGGLLKWFCTRKWGHAGNHIAIGERFFANKSHFRVFEKWRSSEKGRFPSRRIPSHKSLIYAGFSEDEDEARRQWVNSQDDAG